MNNTPSEQKCLVDFSDYKQPTGPYLICQLPAGHEGSHSEVSEPFVLSDLDGMFSGFKKDSTYAVDQFGNLVEVANG